MKTNTHHESHVAAVYDRRILRTGGHSPTLHGLGRVAITSLLFVLALPLSAAIDQKVQDAIIADGVADKAGYDFLGRLCDDFGGRLTGSPNNQGALERTVQELKQLGVEAHLEPFTMPGWVRGDDEVVMLAPIHRTLRVASLSYTQPTPKFEADVVDIKDGRAEDFANIDGKGKIGLLAANTVVPRGQYETAAVTHGMRGILFTDREGGGQLLARTGSFMGDPLKIPVYSITQEEGLWIGRLLQRGQRVRVSMTTRSYCETSHTANIVARFPGKTADTVIVGAHFDSWDLGQGATDNGLGTAQLYAIAKLLKAHAAENLRTIELVWFNGEEQGLWGSRHHTAATRDQPIAAMVNLDMVGYPLSVNALGYDELVPVLERYAASMPKDRLREGVGNVNWFGSDHTSFQLEGIPSITYGAHIDRDVVRYYHDFADTFDKSDPKMISESSATIAALVYRLANEPELTTKRHTPEETEKIFTKVNLEPRMRSIGLWPFDKPAEKK